MEARKSLINDIFNSNRILDIPFFQRAYVWETPQWERFAEDLETISVENSPYFLGSVILKQKLTQSGGNPGDRRTVIDGQTDKVNFMPSVVVVNDGFNQSKLTNKQATGILYLLETKIRFPKMHSTAMFGFNKYSLEHIMPKKWEARWPKVKTDAERITRDQKLLTLGNLTIIQSALNSSINNADWKTKKNGDGKNRGLSTYAADIMTFSGFLSYDRWDEESIAERANFLAEKANEVWEV
jgi:hypothetical protein